MYKCTECNAIFEQCPQYCDCGNDSFIEIPEETPYQNEAPSKPAKKKLSPEEIAKIKKEREDGQKAKNILIASVIIATIIVILPPYPAKHLKPVEKSAISVNKKLPDVNSFWDNSLPSKYNNADSENNLPLLNDNFSSVSAELRNYLVNIGDDFSQNWTPNMVNGTGECKIQFTINRDGIINNKKIAFKSRNESLDDSVLMVLSKITNIDVPPGDYKGERIILSFVVTENSHKVYYPTNN